MDGKSKEIKHPTTGLVINCKVVLIGSIFVGKTCLLNRFINDKFSDEVQPSQGVSFVSRVLKIEEENQSIKFDIWDTSGQEKFRSLNKMFYRDSKIAVLVYDITNKNSFKELIEFWYKEVKSNTDESICKFFNK